MSRLSPKFVSLPLERLSTPALNWIYYSPTRPSCETVEKLISLDSEGSDSDIILDPVERLNTSNIREITFNSTHQQRLTEGRRIVAEAWPELSKLVDNLFEFMAHPPAEAAYESASDPKRFGLIWYRMDSENPFKWSEILAHEMGHHYLYAVSANRAFRNQYDWSTKGYSSIRKEQRPLIGILHAVTAESFILDLFSRLHKTTSQWDFPKIIPTIEFFAPLLISDVQELENLGYPLTDSPLADVVKSAYEFARDHSRESRT